MSEVFCITGCLPIVDNMYFTALFRYQMYRNRYGLVWVWVWKTWFVASTSYFTCEWFARQKEIIYKRYSIHVCIMNDCMKWRGMRAAPLSLTHLHMHTYSNIKTHAIKVITIVLIYAALLNEKEAYTVYPF